MARVHVNDRLRAVFGPNPQVGLAAWRAANGLTGWGDWVRHVTTATGRSNYNDALGVFDFGGAHPVPYRFRDSFDRGDSAKLGNGWLDGKDLFPDRFEPVGITNGNAVVSDPLSRPGVYEDYTLPQDQLPHPPANGEIHPAISFAARETGLSTPDVEVEWCGNWSTPLGHHVECSPLLYVDPSNPRGGFGAWTSEFPDGQGGAVGMLLVGYIGSPPEDFPSYYVGSSTFTADDLHPRQIRLVAETVGQVKVYMDGVQKSIVGYGLDPVPVDESLLGSTMHGFAIDAHFVRPIEDVPRWGAARQITIRDGADFTGI